jgi:hypothetical protein
MLKKLTFFIVLTCMVAGCGIISPAPAQLPTNTPENTPEPMATDTPVPPEPTATVFVPTLAPTQTIVVTPTVKVEKNPLTGLMALADNLNRRPILVKVQNLPRESRPQWGLSLADLVYEYYTEEGSTRFAVVYYGQDATMVGPVRSGRFFDSHLVRMYKAIFAFGSAFDKVFAAYMNSDFAGRMVLEGPNSCQAICRYDPKGSDYLMVNTTAMPAYLKDHKIDNTKPVLDGMTFDTKAPDGGKAIDQVFVRFSGAIYNRWDYDTATNKYLRYSETQNDLNNKNEVYAQLTDRLTSKPITADNVVVLIANYVNTDPKVEVYDINLIGSGKGYIARDGKIYTVKWQRPKLADVLTLTTEDGKPFAFKPGNTWFEVMGAYSKVTQNDKDWRFTFIP